jgi:hypothetical protein
VGGWAHVNWRRWRGALGSFNVEGRRGKRESGGLLGTAKRRRRRGGLTDVRAECGARLAAARPRRRRVAIGHHGIDRGGGIGGGPVGVPLLGR